MLDMGDLPVNIDILLFGNDNLSVEINTFIFSCVQKYTEVSAVDEGSDLECFII
jgi:hypothetical protein